MTDFNQAIDRAKKIRKRYHALERKHHGSNRTRTVRFSPAASV